MDVARVQCVDGRELIGSLTDFTSDGLSVKGRTSGDVALRDVIRVDFDTRQTAPVPGRNLVLLANGDRLVVDVFTADDVQLTVRFSDYPQIARFQIPLEMIRGIAWELPLDRATRLRTVSQILDHSQKADAIVLKNGNTVSGEFLDMPEGKIRLETAAGPLELELPALRSLAFNPELIDFPKRSDIGFVVTLDDGSRFTASQVSVTANKVLNCRAAFGKEFFTSVEHVVSLQILGSRAIYLSDLKPLEYKFTPFLSLKWPLRSDRNVTGGWLRLGDREYTKGLGTHSQCSVSYALDGRYREFRATVGLDDNAVGGNAIARVLVDGRARFTSKPLTGKESVTIRDVDLTGAQRLSLVVDFGDRGDVQDHVNWCDALLVGGDD